MCYCSRGFFLNFFFAFSVLRSHSRWFAYALRFCSRFFSRLKETICNRFVLSVPPDLIVFSNKCWCGCRWFDSMRIFALARPEYFVFCFLPFARPLNRFRLFVVEFNQFLSFPDVLAGRLFQCCSAAKLCACVCLLLLIFFKDELDVYAAQLSMTEKSFHAALNTDWFSSFWCASNMVEIIDESSAYDGLRSKTSCYLLMYARMMFGCWYGWAPFFVSLYSDIVFFVDLLMCVAVFCFLGVVII